MNITHSTEHRRNLTPPSPPLKLRGGWGALSHLSMEGLLSKKGVSLVELMITLTIFSIIISMIYSVYNAFLKTATAERKVAKTELDVINVSWPLIKEIGSAGFGVPSSGSCTPAIDVAGNTLTIHSTAAGDSEHAGKWSYVSEGACAVTGMPIQTASEKTVVINNLDKSRMGFTYVTATTAGQGLYSCTDTDGFKKNIAYWSPYEAAGDLECYETRYYLYSSAAAPSMCASGTSTLGRKSSTSAGGGQVEPMLDCVLDLAYRFGCISSSGNLTWQTGTNCGTSKLRLMKVGMIVQSSPRRDSQVPNTITLFEDLGAALDEPVDLDSINTELRYYKWRKVEQTISLRNLE